MLASGSSKSIAKQAATVASGEQLLAKAEWLASCLLAPGDASEAATRPEVKRPIWLSESNKATGPIGEQKLAALVKIIAKHVVTLVSLEWPSASDGPQGHLRVSLLPSGGRELSSLGPKQSHHDEHDDDNNKPATRARASANERQRQNGGQERD